MLSTALQKIGREYSAAQKESFAQHPLADFIRNEATRSLELSASVQSQGFICEGSPGKGQFAAVPWLAVFDPLVTKTARRGYYVVFLYSSLGPLYLSLNQGATAVRAEFKSDARRVLSERAVLIRARLSDYEALLPIRNIDLGSAQILPRDYESGHALGCMYRSADELTEERLASDLSTILAAYRALTFRGALDATPEANVRLEEDDVSTAPMSLIEVRRYRFHRRIERNSGASAMAKLVHGLACQICGFDFSVVYGELGEGYIAAHHLKPISSLDENVPVKLDVATDFAVLCGNCHRMAHRMDDPGDMNALRGAIGRNLRT